jgi:Protein of unknown function (DUF1580)
MDQDEHLTLSDAAKSLPSRPHLSTIWRWATRGVRGHKLETLVIGGRRYTTPGRISAFLARLNRGEAKSSSTTATRGAQLAAKRLASEGFMVAAQPYGNRLAPCEMREEQGGP